MAVFVQKDYNLTSQIELSQLVIRRHGKLALPLLFRGNAKCGLASASMAEEKLLTHFDIAQLHGDIGVG